MSFPKNEGLEKAVALLKTIIPRQILADIAASSADQEGAELTGPPPPPPLSLTLKGLQTMQSAAKSSVLYAPPVNNGTLTKFCEKLRSAFHEAGLMMGESRPLLLHATILNTIYVKGENTSRRGKGKSREKLMIDARQILDRYEDYLWVGDVPVEKIAICRMGAKKQEDGDEAYEVEAEIDV